MANLGTKRNVLVGAASIFLTRGGPVTTTPAGITRASWVAGAATPEDPATTTVAWTAGFKNAGYTQDGLEVSTDPSFGEVEVDQLLDAPVVFKDGMGLSVSTTFAEATLYNLMVAWGQAGSTLTSNAQSQVLTVAGGSLGDAPIERSLIAIGNAPKGSGQSYRERVYHIYNVTSVEGSGHTMARADGTVIPVTFRAMPADNGDYAVIVDSLT